MSTNCLPFSSFFYCIITNTQSVQLWPNPRFERPLLPCTNFCLVFAALDCLAGSTDGGGVLMSLFFIDHFSAHWQHSLRLSCCFFFEPVTNSLSCILFFIVVVDVDVVVDLVFLVVWWFWSWFIYERITRFLGTWWSFDTPESFRHVCMNLWKGHEGW